MEKIKNSKVLKITQKGTWESNNSTMYKFEIEMSNGDIGEFSTKYPKQNIFFEGQRTQYQLISGKYPKIKGISEGELFIIDFLKSNDIRFEWQKEITNLNLDEKRIRVSDFYLTDYKVYLEFEGGWNANEESKRRYSNKKRVFIENNIPCVYIYPENLGILEFTLPTRLALVLKEHNYSKQLLKLRYKVFKSEGGNANILWLITGTYLLFFKYNNEFDSAVILFVFILYHSVKLFSKIKMILKRY